MKPAALEHDITKHPDQPGEKRIANPQANKAARGYFKEAGEMFHLRSLSACEERHVETALSHIGIRARRILRPRFHPLTEYFTCSDESASRSRPSAVPKSSSGPGCVP